MVTRESKTATTHDCHVTMTTDELHSVTTGVYIADEPVRDSQSCGVPLRDRDQHPS